VSLVGHTKSLLLLANDSRNSELAHWQACKRKIDFEMECRMKLREIHTKYMQSQ
jgi:hypothetical protein